MNTNAAITSYKNYSDGITARVILFLIEGSGFVDRSAILSYPYGEYL